MRGRDEVKRVHRHRRFLSVAGYRRMVCETLTTLWETFGFEPNKSQRRAILHTEGPLFLPAGPGSGKTRVLLWRTVNLIVCHGVKPDEILLGTFTEKAARQLRQGLVALLAEATRRTGVSYDLSRMLIGTIHSICRRILADRRFSCGRMRPGNVRLLDELDQYFEVLEKWQDLLAAGRFTDDSNAEINRYLNGKGSRSRHEAVKATIALFNRFSEECLDPAQAARNARDPTLRKLLDMYRAYCSWEKIDLSRIQQVALEHLRANPNSSRILRHVIVDEYQDTNYVQELLFFHLAGGHRNLCVVGDDDQALYRFRGATVENLVEFEERCQEKLGFAPRRIPLSTNYRSRRTIVDFSSRFIQQIDWRRGPGKTGAYRVEDKQIVPHSRDRSPAVVASAPGHPDAVCAEVATLVRRLLDENKVSDPNQIAFLYPSLKSEQVRRMIKALEEQGLKVYAPRAGRFLEVPEARDVLGVFLILFDRPTGEQASPGMRMFLQWVERAYTRGRAIVDRDPNIQAFIRERQEQIRMAIADRHRLVRAVGERNLENRITDPMAECIGSVRGLSPRAQYYIRRRLPSLLRARRQTGRPLTVGSVVNRVTALDWGVLDLFYELMQFDRFHQAFHLTQAGEDEGPICNLALISHYLSRFQEKHGAVLWAKFLDEGRFVRTFFYSFLYALWRRGESEYEDAEDPFPTGRIPFLTVHQAKGLEFPIVVLGNLYKNESVAKIEEIVRPLVSRRQREPLDRMATFDVARLFYVALSRPQNLLVLCQYKGRGQRINEPFRTLLHRNIPRIADLDLDQVPKAGTTQENPLPQTYSYTADYLEYRACPRRYMIYRRYNFAPARSQTTMVFGNLVHRTIDDLHEWLRVQNGGAIADTEVEQHIHDFFDRNYDLLRQEGGHVIAEGAKRQALEQVLFYWRRLKTVATSVTETEAKLTLPGQVTPNGRPFVIDGVVDIVSNGNEILMYDLKTHDEGDVRAERDFYEGQLNVYAHIWNGIRPQRLDGAAIIATRLPKTLREALSSGDPAALNEAMASWKPVVKFPIAQGSVNRTIQDFGWCIDAIEEGQFGPPSPDQLAQRRRGKTFAERTCANCDARFSCSSYRDYQQRQNRESSQKRSPRTRGETAQAEEEAWMWIEDNQGGP